MKRKQSFFVACGLIGIMSIGLATGCATTNTAAESQFNTAMNACDRMDKPDEREQCVNTVIGTYQVALAKDRKARGGPN